jgi:hypothetical protein
MRSRESEWVGLLPRVFPFCPPVKVSLAGARLHLPALTIEGRVATAIALAHNHPSGVCDPSSADITVTRELRAASKTLDIGIVDHVILGRAEVNPSGKNYYYSFAEAGLL